MPQVKSICLFYNYRDALTTASSYRYFHVVLWLTECLKLPKQEALAWHLITACTLNDPITVRRLVSKIGPGEVDTYNRALCMASYYGSLNVVCWLLHNTTANGDYVGETDQSYGSMTPLAAACSWAHYLIAKLLVQRTSLEFINKGTAMHDDAPLHLAIWCNDGKMSELHKVNYFSYNVEL